jgi:hypothetical protein
MTGWLRDDKEGEIFGASVEQAMAGSWRDLQSLVRLQSHCGSIESQDRLTLQHIEELPGSGVVMTHFRGSGRHALLNDAQLSGPDQMPPITTLSPPVMRSAVDRDLSWLHR